MRENHVVDKMLSFSVLHALLLIAVLSPSYKGLWAQSAPCQVEYSVVNQWPTGFQGQLMVTNNEAAINGWTVTWSFEDAQTITQLWNGVVSQSGTSVSVANASFDASIPAGGSVVFGFIANLNGATNSTPIHFALNGGSCGGAGIPPPPPPPGGTFVESWAASPQRLSANTLSNATLRQIVHLGVGGNALRVRLDNTFGSQAAQFSNVHVAIQSNGAAIAAGTDHRVTFGGSTSVSVPQGGSVVSDPVDMTVAAQANLAISMFLSSSIAQQSGHSDARQTSFVSTSGDHAADPGAGAFPTTMNNWLWLSGVNVRSSTVSGIVVAFGDSITNGLQSTINANHRWPNILANRLLAATPNQPKGVLDEGIDGDVLSNFGLRVNRDVIGQTGVSTVIELLGVNDIGAGNASATTVINHLQQLISTLHARGLRVIGGTITPFGGNGFYDTPAHRAARDAVNQFIRTGGAFDGIVDFDMAIRDPADPERMAPSFDSSDHLHPNDAGYNAMGNAINLSLLH